MIKCPCRKDGTIRYFEIIKLSVFANFLLMVYANYLEVSPVLFDVGLMTQIIVFILFMIQIILTNFELLSYIIVFLSITLIKLIRFKRNSLNKVIVLIQPYIEFNCFYGLKPHLTYRVIRV